MNCLKTSFTIALLACFLTVKTNAQVGLTMNHVKKSVVMRPQKQFVPKTPVDLKLPKYYNKSGWFKIELDFFGDPSFSSTEALDRHNQNVILQNKSMNFDFRNNALNVILSRDATVFDRVVGTTLLLFGN